MLKSFALINVYLAARKTQDLLIFQKELFSNEINITICVRFQALKEKPAAA